MPGEDIIDLNVGGVKFTTSKHTLNLFSDTFFSSLLSGRIESFKDDSGAIFIDRDPILFSVILNYMRSQYLELKDVNIDALKHEAEFYGLNHLVRKLSVCSTVDDSSCGNIMFHCYVAPPLVSPPIGAPGLGCGLLTHESHVSHITGQLNWIAVVRSNIVNLYRMTDQHGCQPIWTCEAQPSSIYQVAINARPVTRTFSNAQASDIPSVVLAVAVNNCVVLWLLYINMDGNVTRQTQIGALNMSSEIDALLFAGGQLVSLNFHGKVGVWHSMTQNWRVHDTEPITSYDTAGTLLLLGRNNGTICSVDMHKFPLRMSDNDLLISDIYRDPNGESITALSLYLTPKISTIGNWIEIAYGTNKGIVRIITEHPESLGKSPQLFQTFTVHTSKVIKVTLSHKHLISICEESKHVRTWDITRFRGMISTQPGSVPLASFNLLELHNEQQQPTYSSGPFGDKDSQQLFIQRIVPNSSKIFIRLVSTGQRVCEISSVDDSDICTYFILECEGSSVGRCFLFTGHMNSSIQIWDMSTALDLLKNDNRKNGSPNTREILDALGNCKLTTGNSLQPTPTQSPYPTIEKTRKIVK